jgi:hypothetical protein
MRIKPNFTYTAAAVLAAEISGQVINGLDGFTPFRPEWFSYTPGSPTIEARLDASESFCESLPVLSPEATARIRCRVEDVLRKQPSLAIKLAREWHLSLTE